MIDFGSPSEAARAMLLAAKYLPALLNAFEDGVREMGLEVAQRSHYRDGSGAAVPVLVVKGRRNTFRLELRNALEDFLTEDREADPVRVDPRLGDEAYAQVKLAALVRDRLALVEAMEQSRDLDDAKARIEALGDRFEWLRAAFVDDDKEDSDDEE